MRHSDFIAKMAKYKPWFEFQTSAEGKDTTTKAIAEKSGVLPCVAANGVRFYDRHKDEPQRPEFGQMTHAAVMDASHFLHLKDPHQLRLELIRHYGTDIDAKIKPPIKFLSRRIIRQLLKNSGLEWFEKKGRPFVHWKHNAELV